MNGFMAVAIIFGMVLACGAITEWQDLRAYRAWLRNRPHCNLSKIKPD